MPLSHAAHAATLLVHAGTLIVQAVTLIVHATCHYLY